MWGDSYIYDNDKLETLGFSYSNNNILKYQENWNFHKENTRKSHIIRMVTNRNSFSFCIFSDFMNNQYLSRSRNSEILKYTTIQEMIILPENLSFTIIWMI